MVTEERIVREGMRTPWGPAQAARELIPGIGVVHTAGHGGIKVSAERNRQIPKIFRADGGWYEEDLACNVPLHFFRDEFPKGQWPGNCLDKHDPLLALKTWYWKQYEQHFGVTLQPGESSIKDEDTFKLEHREDFLVCTAWGSHPERPDIPEGWVGVCARRASDGVEKYFLVRDKEYAARRGAFLIDLDRHPEIARIW